ncbi:MAG: GatB/YqeY domain-containing protein [Chthoniobacterales bacterium]|nr:GatB/YqeY domain-containing protein [Chthoniobacterales bacterium]
MTLTAKIDHDIKEAMKARDADRLGSLRMLKSSLKYAVIEKGAGTEADLADTDVITVLRKRIKQCQDAIDGFVKGGRAEQAEKEKAEMSLLESYLPAGLSAEELSVLVRSAIAETGATGKAQMGAVMKVVMANAAGRTDGKAVNAEVLKQLG